MARQHLRTWLSGTQCGGAELMAGLSHRTALFQPHQFCDSMGKIHQTDIIRTSLLLYNFQNWPANLNPSHAEELEISHVQRVLNNIPCPQFCQITLCYLILQSFASLTPRAQQSLWLTNIQQISVIGNIWRVSVFLGQSQNAAVCLQQKGDPFFIEITGSAFFPGTCSQYSHFSCVIMHSANALSSVLSVWTRQSYLKKKNP